MSRFVCRRSKPISRCESAPVLRVLLSVLMQIVETETVFVPPLDPREAADRANEDATFVGSSSASPTAVAAAPAGADAAADAGHEESFFCVTDFVPNPSGGKDGKDSKATTTTATSSSSSAPSSSAAAGESSGDEEDEPRARAKRQKTAHSAAAPVVSDSIQRRALLLLCY